MEEKLAVYESKMTKTYDGLVKEFAAIRACLLYTSTPPCTCLMRRFPV